MEVDETERGTYGVLLQLVPKCCPHRRQLREEVPILRREHILLLPRPLELLLKALYRVEVLGVAVLVCLCCIPVGLEAVQRRGRSKDTLAVEGLARRKAIVAGCVG